MKSLYHFQTQIDWKREMAYIRAAEILVWVVVVAAIVAVAENGRMCLALGTEEAKNTVTNMAEGAKIWTDDMDKAKNAASDGNKYESDSTTSTKDTIEGIYNEARQKVEEAYYSVAENGFSEEAKAKYEAAKERASDAAGEVGAKMRQ